jgi:hypothetical protein
MDLQPVTAAEIADLMRRIHRLQRHLADPKEQAEALSYKAELLARIAHQQAQDWGDCDDTTKLLQIAHEAQQVADNARRLVQSGEQTPPIWAKPHYPQ